MRALFSLALIVAAVSASSFSQAPVKKIPIRFNMPASKAVDVLVRPDVTIAKLVRKFCRRLPADYAVDLDTCTKVARFHKSVGFRAVSFGKDSQTDHRLLFHVLGMAPGETEISASGFGRGGMKLGEPLPRFSKPWIVGITTDDGLCTGSLIHPEWVVTAAHCVVHGKGTVTPASVITVHVGYSDISADGRTEDIKLREVGDKNIRVRTADIEVERVVVHDRYRTTETVIEELQKFSVDEEDVNEQKLDVIDIDGLDVDEIKFRAAEEEPDEFDLNPDEIIFQPVKHTTSSGEDAVAARLLQRLNEINDWQGFDIALLGLKYSAVQPANIPIGLLPNLLPNIAHYVPVSDAVIAAGYGRDTKTEFSIMAMGRKARRPTSMNDIVTFVDGKLKFGRLRLLKPDDVRCGAKAHAQRELCAIDPEGRQSIDNGDSGGPLFISEHNTLLGITSRSQNEEYPDLPDYDRRKAPSDATQAQVFTSLKFHLPWIVSHTGHVFVSHSPGKVESWHSGSRQ